MRSGGASRIRVPAPASLPQRVHTPRYRAVSRFERRAPGGGWAILRDIESCSRAGRDSVKKPTGSAEIRRGLLRSSMVRLSASPEPHLLVRFLPSPGMWVAHRRCRKPLSIPKRDIVIYFSENGDPDNLGVVIEAAELGHTSSFLAIGLAPTRCFIPTGIARSLLRTGYASGAATCDRTEQV